MENKNPTAYLSTDICERKKFLSSEFYSRELEITSLKYNFPLEPNLETGDFSYLALGLKNLDKDTYYMLAKSGVINQFLSDMNIYDIYNGKLQNPDKLKNKFIEVFFNRNNGLPLALSPIFKIRHRKKKLGKEI